MKSFYGVFAAVSAVFAVLFAAANLLLGDTGRTENDRPYRVEINRLALAIGERGLENVDLSECVYVTGVAEYGENFFGSPSDYVVREINGALYRFDYTFDHTDSSARVIVNAALGTAFVAAAALLFYIRARILLPFNRLTSVPYELSKGNLTAPVKENRSRFFGKFLWGMDMLRENIERHKQRELALQREKKTLLLSLSHDIKTPLSAIKLYSGALSKRLYADPEKQREIAEKINDRADEIENYVSQMIEASREDLLSLEVNMGEFYLSDLVNGITALYAEKSALLKVSLRIGGYRNCLLTGDLDRAEEVLQNVLENALKYGDGRSVEIVFGEEDGCTLVSVRNGGCTLEKEELPHIFESFWRGGNSENTDGSGLGLYICRLLMRKMGGDIFAELAGETITVTAVFGRV